MNNLTTNIGHIIVTVVIIGAAVALALHNTITGGEAIALIAGAGGVSLGGAVASSSAASSVPSSVNVSTSPGTSTLTLNGASTTAVPTTPPVVPTNTSATP
jgi:hypothetical protein